ncbi:MAG: hypothetical protein LM587_02330 [Candidatus Aenigmarchaeota archaeon]|nr:hypothetical protein [Candidatus Aenigmarchaeota archaeon]
MHPLAKAFIGVLVVLAALYYIFVGIPGYLRPALPDVLTVLNGAVPIVVILLGTFIVWLEWDEWKIERELAKEEKKLEKEKRRKKK